MIVKDIFFVKEKIAKIYFHLLLIGKVVASSLLLTNIFLNWQYLLWISLFSGIGYQTALDLAKRGARVIITSENEKDVVRARGDIIKETGNQNIVAKYLDLTSFAVVRTFAKDILQNEKKLDILINNAGSVGFGNNYSKDGLLLGLQVNYYGMFLLTHLLIGKL